MPWHGWTLMDLRRNLIKDYHSQAWTMVALSEAYGVSRKTAYKWLQRFEAEGTGGLADRSRRPHDIFPLRRTRHRRPYRQHSPASDSGILPCR